MFDPFEYLVLRHKDGLLKTDFKRPLGKVCYHIPCHGRVQNIGQKTREMLQARCRAPQVNTVERCSGHDGTWGVKSEYFANAMKIGRPVFKADGRGPSPTTSAPTARSPAATSQQGMGETGARGEGAPARRCCASPTDCRSRDDAACAKITRDSLLTLEAYAKAAQDFRARVIAHKQLRSVALGEHVTLQFEDELTIRYQIQEMLRIEKIFEEDGIQDEIDAYKPLVPDGSNWKATMLIEYPDADERKRELARLIGVEDRVLVEVEGCARVLRHRRRRPRARERREDLGGALPALRAHRSRWRRRSSRGLALAIGVDHPEYRAEIPAVPPTCRNALVADLA